MPELDPAIRASQEAYAARPFAVRWCDSHYSGTHRFHTLDDAHQYIQEQWEYIRVQVATRWNCASMLHMSYLITPDSTVSLRYVLLADDVSSY